MTLQSRSKLSELLPAGVARPRRGRRSPWAPRTISFLICLGVFGAIGVLRWRGDLQFLELKAYDLLVASQPKDLSFASQIVVLGMNDDDIEALGYPISDEQMAELLKKVIEGKPRAVGIDIFRDREEGEGREDLMQVLSDERVVSVMLYGTDGKPIPAPKGVKPAQVGLADFDKDGDGRIRRALLFFTDPAGKQFRHMAVRLATRYLSAVDKGLKLARIEGKSDEWFRLGKAEYRVLRPHDGGYVRADTRGDQILFDFRGPRDFDPIPFNQVIKGAVTPDHFTDKVVIIGMASHSVKDHLSTARVTEQYGPAVHGVLVEQLIRAGITGRGPPRFWPDSAEYAWTLGWTLLGGVLGLLIRGPVTFAIKLTLVVAALLASVYAAFAFGGLWLPSVPPLLGCVAAAGFVTQYMSHHERSERFVLNELFKRSVDTDVAETLWARRDELLDDGQLVAKQVRATVLFTDLEGFTTITEAMDKSALMALLNDYIAVMSDCVSRRRDAFVNKYIGDAVMAVFGPPLERTAEEARADARNAVECALEMRAKLVENRDRWERACLEGIRMKRDAEGGGGDGAGTLPDVHLRMRIGIQSGVVTAGSLGSRQRLEYTVIGDTVNTAARLEAYEKDLMPPDLAADGCRILIGRDTLDLLPAGEYLTREVGSIQLKGKAQLVSIHGVIGHGAPASRDPAGRAEAVAATEPVGAG